MRAWTPSDSNQGVSFVQQESMKDASINVLLSFKGVFRDWVEFLENCEVISFAVLEMDPQKWNKSISLLAFPSKFWGGTDAQPKNI